MAFSVHATPQRPLPGAFLNTPAAARLQPSTPGQSSRPPAFRVPSSTFTTMSRPAGPEQETVTRPRPGHEPEPGVPAVAGTPSSAPQPLTHIEGAARVINQNLALEMRYPALDDYVTQGISSDYDMPSGSSWAPFQKVKTYEIPDRIFEQYNTSQMAVSMGLFAELQHAWMAIDNALYLWDYTHPNPELIGFEEQPHTIQAVKLVTPRAGVFVKDITHLLVVSTISDIFLLGLASSTNQAGVKSVALYQTNMQIPIKGTSATCIAGSSKTGRIFFAGRSSMDVLEITYQQDERWFRGKCGRINHTAPDVISSLSPQALYSSIAAFAAPPPEKFVIQLEVDDSRSLLYVLSSDSTIRVFHLKQPNTVVLLITKRLNQIMGNIGHMITKSELFPTTQKIVSIVPISHSESSRLNLMAITSTGVRIFLSATSGTYYSTDANTTPSSMQVHHVRFPPPSPSTAPPPQGTSAANQLVPLQNAPAMDVNSNSLTPTRAATRFSPGYFFCFVGKENVVDTLFICTPDSGKISRPQEPTGPLRFQESGQWLSLGSLAEDIGLITKPFAASSSPAGFGNEMAVQFDQPATEVAVLTNSGVHVFRRRRLVDIFASAMRYAGSDEGFETAVKTFIRLYGRSETCASAIAVACGQGMDLTVDSRIANITDPEVIELARRAFIEHGGKPTVLQEVEVGASPLDSVRQSPRADGLTLYISRLIRSLWKSTIMTQGKSPTGGLAVSSTVSRNKLKDVQRALSDLNEFLDKNKSFIEGLSGPEALGRVATMQDELALRGEHRALNQQLRTITDTIEGIAFVEVLFGEPVDEIFLSLSETSRTQFKQLTYEGLFTTQAGRSLAKELVKAIVNRNIAAGSNVDTVAEALRRKCGSFCSADDVVIFKAQEQLKKASEAGADSSAGRSLLNESLKLFEKVAGSLPLDYLKSAVDRYTDMAFYAGAIRLCLTVAQQRDRVNLALAWIKDGAPEQDTRRKEAYTKRTMCYTLVCSVITAVDQASSQSSADGEVQAANIARRKEEAYVEIDQSEDEVFQTFLYDWYLGQGWSDRLLELSSPGVVTYLQRKSKDDIAHADLLWRYYAHFQNYFDAAQVQLQLAKSGFNIDLSARMEYLSRAKANISTRTPGIQDFGRSKQSRQEVVREITDLLDLAGIQIDILRKLESDPRLTPERKPTIVEALNGQILTLDDLYNGYADQAGYYDICLTIYQVGDYRNTSDIAATWQNLIMAEHRLAVESNQVQPYEVVAEKVRSMGKRLNCSETTFSTKIILPLLLDYAFSPQNNGNTGPATWPVDVLLDLHVPYESILAVLEPFFYNNEAMWGGSRRRLLANLIVYVSSKWMADSARGGGVPFGGEENASAVLDTLRLVENAGVLTGVERDVLSEVMMRVERVLR